jgi:GPI mannosyltransferase 3
MTARIRPATTPCMGDDPANGVTRRDWLVVLGLALALRLASAGFETVLHPDEVYQYLEGAFRTTHGYSVMTWEYRDGMRADLYPWLLSWPMRLGEWIAPDSRLPILLPRIAMAVLSLGIVGAAGWLGARVSRAHFWTAGLVAAVWTDLVGFAPHPLTEQMAALLAVPAIALLAKRDWSARVLAGIGFALGLAFLFRPHLAPAIGLAALCYLWTVRFAGLAPLLGGSVLALAVGAGSDWLGGDYPFEWMVNNFTRNIVDNVSARYGVSGPLAYVGEVWQVWSIWTLPILALAAWGARRYPLLLIFAAANIVVHSAIGHKEYRFLIPSLTALILLAGVATADFADWWAKRRGLSADGRLRLLVVVWLLAAATVVPVYKARDTFIVTDFTAKAIDEARGRPDLCGFALVGREFDGTYGYARLRRDVPIFIRGRGDPAIDPALYNHAVVWNGFETELSPAFDRKACTGGEQKQCVYVRKGGCSGAPSPSEINRYLREHDM